MYLSKGNRQSIVMLLALSAQINELRDTDKLNEWFGKNGASWMKQASTLVIKSFEEGLVPQLTEKERMALNKQIESFANIKNIEMPIDVAYDLAERAIGNTCKGCTIEKYKKCGLYESLDFLNIPPANDEKSSCPYKQ